MTHDVLPFIMSEDYTVIGSTTVKYPGYLLEFRLVTHLSSFTHRPHHFLIETHFKTEQRD